MSQIQQRDRKTAILTPKGLQKLEAAKLETSASRQGAKTHTLEALSERTGLSTHTLSKIHNGRAGADLRTLTRYFRAFDLILETSDYRQASNRPEPGSPVKDDTFTGLVQSDSPGFGTPEFETPGFETLVSWDVAPNVSRFYGNTNELATLQHWILVDRCRFVMILGLAGTGKTWLATKLTEQIQNRFKIVIWRSFRPISRSHSSLPFQDFLDDLIDHLMPHSAFQVSAPIATKVRQLLKLLNQFPCLLVLDHVEAVLQAPESPTITEQADYEAYSNLFKYLGQGRHQSTIILTSRSELPLFDVISDPLLGMQSLVLKDASVTDVPRSQRHLEGIEQGEVGAVVAEGLAVAIGASQGRSMV
jgi:transcriptional regulator with XRE-family HTH domain